MQKKSIQSFSINRDLYASINEQKIFLVNIANRYLALKTGMSFQTKEGQNTLVAGRQVKNKSFWKEQIMSLNIIIKAGKNKPYFYIRVHREELNLN